MRLGDSEHRQSLGQILLHPPRELRRTLSISLDSRIQPPLGRLQVGRVEHVANRLGDLGFHVGLGHIRLSILLKMELA